MDNGKDEGKLKMDLKDGKVQKNEQSKTGNN